MNHTASLYEQQFDKRFELVPATTSELVTACKRLRYQVYCEERKHFDTDNFIEEDVYDDQAVQMLLRDKISGEYVATVRLVLSPDRDQKFRYPLEEFLTKHNHTAVDMIKNLPKARTAEISRLSISKELRQQYKKMQSADDENMRDESVGYGTLITIGLFKAITIMSAEKKITNWLALMEPSLLRLLSRVGIEFNVHGTHMNHFGKRYACNNTVEDVLGGIRAANPDVWSLITDNGKLATQ